MEDNRIIDALLAEPETGLQLLLTQYGGLIHTVICRILPNNPQDAEECAADVLVAAWKHAAEFKQKNRPLRAWLCVTARNAAIDRWRALRPRQQECELNDELAQDWMTERRSTEAEELIAQLLTELPEPDREIFFPPLLLQRVLPRNRPQAEHAGTYYQCPTFPRARKAAQTVCRAAQYLLRGGCSLCVTIQKTLIPCWNSIPQKPCR